jgi:peptide/nickel transport system permease protein
VRRLLPPLRHVGALTATAVGLATIVAALPWLSGQDPALSVLRARLPNREPDPAALAAVRSELDLAPDPVHGAARWLAGAVTGDLGRSWVDGTPVRESVAAAVGVSAGLAAAASAAAVMVALVLVMPMAWAASGEHRASRTGARVVSAGVAAIPEFVLATVLLTLVAVRWRLAPTAGWFGPSYVVLPALALGVPTGGLLARLIGTAMDGVAMEPWVRTWLATGCGRVVLMRAILRRAVVVAVPQVAVLFVAQLGSAVVVENLFAVPGLGRLALRATLAQDLPLVQGCVLVLILAGVAVGAVGIAVHRGLLGPAGPAAGLVPAVPAGHRTGWAPVLVGAVLTTVILAGLLRDPGTVRLDQRLTGPSWDHPMGTDPVGRDILALFGHGALLTIGAAALVTAAALAIGLAVGLRGVAARVGTADVLLALPPILVGLIVAAIFGTGLGAAAAAAALVTWVPLSIHARNLADEARASGYHQAAVLAGAGAGWLLRRHLMPAVVGPVLVNALTRVPSTALTIAALGFLGVGAGHDSPEWGAQLGAALAYLERAPLGVLAPVLGLALLGVLAGFATPERSGSGAVRVTARGAVTRLPRRSRRRPGRGR